MSPSWPEIIAFMWDSGIDTFDIAESLRIDESEVYNTLARLRDERRRERAA